MKRIYDVGQRVQVKPDALSAWRGCFGTVSHINKSTGSAAIDLEKDCLRISFWFDELIPAARIEKGQG